MSSQPDFVADPSNSAMVEAWDGNEGAFWTAEADHFEGGIAASSARFLAAAAIGADDDVLDIGCGFGRTTCHVARLAVNGSALGVDLSSQMLALARKTAADQGLDNVSFEHADAQIHPFEDAAFDIAISQMGAMFFGDPVAAFTNIHRALRPGGRLTLLTWQAFTENEWFNELRAAIGVVRELPPPNAQGPFSLAEPDRVRAILDAAGFADVSLESVREPMFYGRDADDAFDFISGFFAWVRNGLDDADRQRLDDAFRATIAAHTGDHGVAFQSATWIIRARKP